MEVYAVDYETYYDRVCSIKRLGTLGYFSHPEFDAYMVSVVGSDGYTFVGPPSEFDWGMLEGQIVLSHNASFDETLYLYGVERGWWPRIHPLAWHCTADMAAACGLPRSLKNASAQAFDLEVSKTTRDNMAGKRWENMTGEFQEEVRQYALKDSELCLRLWEEYNEFWPEREREISRVNRRIIQRGLPMNVDLLAKQLVAIKQKLFEAEQDIPWSGERPLLSRGAFDDECHKNGIEPPASLAQKDLEAQEWIERHSGDHKWVEAVSNWRRVNALKKMLESFDVATMSDNRYYGGLMYWGGHTGRFSGGGGNLNLQNLPREELFGVNLRHLIHAPEGKKLVVVDLAQIEVRTLCWLAEDKKTLKEIAASDDIYEAFAIRMGLWAKDKGSLKETDPKLRHKVKAIILGCGYGAGAETFSRLYNMPLEDAQEAVDLYRDRLERVPKYWKRINSKLYNCYNNILPFKYSLPSGRDINYGKTKMVRQNGRIQHQALMNRNGKRLPMKLWGGVVAENLSQGLARDIFADMMLRIEEAGIKIIFHVHDEFIIECQEEDAQDVLASTLKIMSEPPSWIPDIPLAAEGKILSHYQK
jgi:DNA polymerase